MEIVLLVATIPFLWYFFRKIGMPLFASMAVAAVLEIVNETVFAGVGTFYPEVVLPFPFFKFPVLIVLIAGIYSGIVNFAALKISQSFSGKYLRAAVFMISAAVLNIVSIVVESVGIYSGFWQHRQPSGISTIYFAVYVYYLLIVFAASIFTAFSICRRNPGITAD